MLHPQRGWLIEFAGSVSLPQQSNTYIVNAQQRPQLGHAGAQGLSRQPTPQPPLSEDDKKFLNKPVSHMWLSAAQTQAMQMPSRASLLVA